MSDRKIKPQFSNPFAEVEISPATVAGETVPTRVAVRVKDDEGTFQFIDFVGKDYQLLPNRKVRDIAEDIMSRTGGEYGGFRNLKTLWDGKRYVDYFASNSPIATAVNGSKTELCLGLMAWNAYDGTRRSGFEVFALNPFCTNQYVSRNRFGYFAWAHTPGEAGKIDVEDAMEGIRIGVQNIIKAAPMIGEMKHRELTLPMLTEARLKTEMPVSKWGEVLERLDIEFKTEKTTQFALYQALTHVNSHSMSGMSALKIGTSITEHFLGGPEKPVMHHTTAQVVVGGAR